MAYISDYRDGTVSLATGTRALVGDGTAWTAIGLQSGDMFMVGGFVALIETVVDDTHITLRDDWGGPSLPTGSSYSIKFSPDQSRVQASVVDLIRRLSNGNIDALSALTLEADRLIYADGPNSLALTTLTAYARGLIAATDAAATMTALGASAIGQALLTAPNPGAAQDAIGASATGKAVLTAADEAEGRTAIGAAGATEVAASFAGVDAEFADVEAALAKRVRVDAAQPLTSTEQAQARANTSSPLKGHIIGLTLANSGADTINDIDILPGEAASTEVNPVLMVLPAPGITKRLDAPWAVGTSQGGLDTGSIADRTYHVWLIRRSDTGGVDVLFSASATAPTMPASYDQKRRIGSIIRKGGAIAPFQQIGDEFFWQTSVVDRSSTSEALSGLLAVSVPTGIVVQPYFKCAQQQGVAGNSFTLIGNAGKSLDAIGDVVVQTLDAGTFISIPVPLRAYTNTSAQIQFSVTVNGSLAIHQLCTIGWVDSRGRNS